MHLHPEGGARSLAAQMMPPLLPFNFRRPAAVLLGLMLALALPEIVLSGADAGLWGAVIWRPLAYQYGGFWSGLLRDWQPNYALQPATMFLSHVSLHAGPGHLIGNLLALWVLGMGAVSRLGSRGFLMLVVASGLGGALGFGLLSQAPAPMVGASGVVFGLAGAWTIWDRHDRRSRNLSDRSLMLVLLVVMVNAASWWIMEGQLAWQTHLGGYLAGALFSALWHVRAATKA